MSANDLWAAVAGPWLRHPWHVQPRHPGGWGEVQATPSIQNPYVFGLINRKEEAADIDYFSNYAMLLLGVYPDDNPFARMKAANPDILLISVTNPYFPTGFVLYPEYTNAERVRPNWVLRTQDGQVISYAGSRYSYMVDNPSMMDLASAEWNIDLGAPVAEATVGDGVWRREFENTWVYVNPDKRAVSFTPDGAAGAQELAAFSAVILQHQ